MWKKVWLGNYFKLKIYQAELKRCQLPSIQMEINIVKNSKTCSIWLIKL